MKKFKLTILGTGALALMLGLNIRHAVNNYGIMDGKLHTEILAQSNSSGGGSGSGGSGSGNGSGSGGDGSGSGGYELPEVVITCGQYYGQCWKNTNCYSGEYTIPCEWSGRQHHYCL
ncbi:MAG: hypothetical protein LBL33_02430 [Tannerella sp.]|jgi:hypothetical protein|nr:hypothetical protein [Tannerella sp.]